MPFLSDGPGVKIPFHGVFKDRSELFTQMESFHRFIMYFGSLCECAPVSQNSIISLVLFIFRSRYDSSHHSVKS